MGRERGHQRHNRFAKRLEATFGAGGLSYRGILSNLSESGLFIRTNRGFAPDTIIDIELIMPDSKVSRLKGVVKRTIRRPVSTIKNGMGIELIEKDKTYLNFVKSFTGEKITKIEEKPAAEKFKIVFCQKCGIKNKVLINKFYRKPKCGKCGTPLVIEMS
ncbi:MAG: PilZ domain-containing protein [Nitrospirae bacterium]|jgi:hypothetical protein|nr:PilZ domain-containing protein [Nitrospirota bacterium]